MRKALTCTLKFGKTAVLSIPGLSYRNPKP
jgi:hypothetical protein